MDRRSRALLLLVLGLCSCSSYYTPPADGPTATINEIQYYVEHASVFEETLVDVHDINSEGCFINSQRLSSTKQGEFLIPANKTVGMSFFSRASLDTDVAEFEASCEVRVGMQFWENQEYVINIQHSNRGCLLTVIDTTRLQAIPVEQAKRDNTFQNYCIDYQS